MFKISHTQCFYMYPERIFHIYTGKKRLLLRQLAEIKIFNLRSLKPVFHCNDVVLKIYLDSDGLVGWVTSYVRNSQFKPSCGHWNL